MTRTCGPDNKVNTMNFALLMLVLLRGDRRGLAAGPFWSCANAVARMPAEPWWVEYPKSFFPIILLVFLLRSFLVEPFKIPSGSMIPTLLVGDFILVNKFTYGIRLPVINKKIADINQPQRGEVMVFRYPENPTLDYIKRVVGLPGDHVEYRNKRLSINGALVPVETAEDFQYVDGGLSFVNAMRFLETLGRAPSLDHRQSRSAAPATGRCEAVPAARKLRLQ